MALPAGPLTHLLALCADLDGIGDQLGCLFLLQTGHFLQLDGNLEGQVGQKGPEPSLPRGHFSFLRRLTVVSQRKMLL